MEGLPKKRIENEALFDEKKINDRYKIVTDWKPIDRHNGNEDIPRYEFVNLSTKFKRVELIRKEIELGSGSKLVVSSSEFMPHCYTYDILIIPIGESYNEKDYWKWDLSKEGKNMIKGDGSLEALRKAFLYLRDELIPLLREKGASELWISPSDEERSRAYKYVERLGFRPMIEIQRDENGKIVYQGPIEYLLKF